MQVELRKVDSPSIAWEPPTSGLLGSLPPQSQNHRCLLGAEIGNHTMAAAELDDEGAHPCRLVEQAVRAGVAEGEGTVVCPSAVRREEILFALAIAIHSGPDVDRQRRE